MIGHKRKRDDDDEADDDPSYGMRQILPVACLPANFNGEPTDGMQYLFTVRRDAKLLPTVTRVPNPYETPLDPTVSSLKVESPSDEAKGVTVFPSKAWRSTFIQRFKGFRDNLSQPTTTSEIVTPRSRAMPDKRDREAWWDFLSGAPESAWNKPPSRRSTKSKRKGGGARSENFDPANPDVIAAGWQVVQSSSSEHVAVAHETVVPSTSSDPTPPKTSSTSCSSREPTPALILSIDHRMAVHLIMYFTHWINQYADALQQPKVSATNKNIPLESHARWIFALLARIDLVCSADDMNGLRALVRACLAFLRVQKAPTVDPSSGNDAGYADSDIASTPGARTIDLPPVVDDVIEAAPSAKLNQTDVVPTMSASSVQLILCAIAEFWGQRDLWTDAESAFP